MAGLTVQCRDEMSDGEWLMERKMTVEGERTTVREFIRARIEQETSEHNSELDRGRGFRGLVYAPPAVTSELNGWAGRKRVGTPVDADVMIGLALEAYERGDLELVVDDTPAGDLDSEIVLADGSKGLFRKKVPLIVPQPRKGRRIQKGGTEEVRD